MKLIIAFAAFVAVALAAPQLKQYEKSNKVILLKEVPSNNIGLDGYKFAFELSDGQTREETADVEHLRGVRSEEDNSIIRLRGSFSYVNPTDGQTYSVTYVADENGFQPQGAHLPKVA